MVLDLLRGNGERDSAGNLPLISERERGLFVSGGGCDRLHGLLQGQDFIKKKDVGQKRANMQRGVEVVDELR